MRLSVLREYSQIILYFLIFNLSILSITVTLHELGHLYLGYLNGCTGKVVLVDLEEGAYCEIICDHPVQKEILSLGCFLFAVPFSILFLGLNLPERNFFYVVLGLDISTSALDMVNVFHSEIVFPIPIIIGIFLIVYGEALLTRKWIFVGEDVTVKL
jgi:hypothetical protein